MRISDWSSDVCSSDLLNRDYPDDYVKSPDELILLPGVGPAVARLNAMGWPVAICTNQSCIGKGIIDEAMLALIPRHLRARQARAGRGRLDESQLALRRAPREVRGCR